MYAGKAAYDAATTLPLGDKPCATSSTYCLFVASVLATGVATLEMTLPQTSTVPIPVGFKKTLLFAPVASMLTLVVLPTMKSVTTFAFEVILPVTSSEDSVPTDVMLGCAAV